MRFAKVASGSRNHLRDQKFCVKGNEKKPMKKMNVFQAKALRESIFAVRRQTDQKAKFKNQNGRRKIERGLLFQNLF
jgi:hypothetical protein